MRQMQGVSIFRADSLLLCLANLRVFRMQCGCNTESPTFPKGGCAVVADEAVAIWLLLCAFLPKRNTARKSHGENDGQWPLRLVWNRDSPVFPWRRALQAGGATPL